MRVRRVAFLPSASREPAQRGVLRLASRDSRPAIVRITAYDDTGRPFGPATVSLAPSHALELTASDLQGGNPIKGLHRGIGAGQGDWRLVVQSSAKFDALAYVETAEGLRTPLGGIGQSPDGIRHVPLFPAADAEAPGLLRLSNPSEEAATAIIQARDDTGHTTEVRVTLPPRVSRWLTVSALESGKGITGALGNGTGDWRLAIWAERKGKVEDALAAGMDLHEMHGGAGGRREHTAPEGMDLHEAHGREGDRREHTAAASMDLHEMRRGERDRRKNTAAARMDFHEMRGGGRDRRRNTAAADTGPGGEGILPSRRAAKARNPVQAFAFSTTASGELANLASSHRLRSPPDGGRATSTRDASLWVEGIPPSIAPEGPFWGEGVSPSIAPEGRAGSPPTLAHAAWLPATTPATEALLRIASHTPRPGTATLHLNDDAWPREPLVLALDANAAVTLTASDLEFGNSSKGLPRGFGAISSNLRITARSSLELDLHSYARDRNGTVSAMHDTAPRAGPSNLHTLAMFPAGSGDAEGRLMLSNRSNSPARVHITGTDDEGHPSQPATLTLPPNATQTLTSSELAWGAPRLDGWLGAGRGHWRLSVWSDAPLDVTALHASPTGALSNISAATSSLSTTRHAPHPIGDLNGDGKDDVLLRHTDGRWMYYPMNGRTPIASQRGTVPLERSAHWQLAGIADMDGDNKDDILLRHTNGQWKGYLMDGRTVRQSGSIPGLPTATEWSVAGLGDLGGRGKTDVVLRNANGSWSINPLDGLTVAPSTAVEPNLTKSLKWSVAGIADLNGDNRDDILLRHDDGRWHYYPMNGSLAGSGRGSVTGVTRSLDWHLAGLGDLDGDGKDDVLLRHVEGRWTFYPMNGRNVADGRGGVPLTPNTAWTMAGLGDFNGDGKADALLRNDDGRWTYYPLDGRTILAGRGTARITQNRDWSTTGPEPEPDEATKDEDPSDETAENVFASSISPIVQSQCATCHVAGGVSGNTRLVFVAGDGGANLEVFETFLAEVDGGGELILNKVQGVDHGGGIQLAAGTDGFASMERLLGLLTDGPGTGPSITPATLFAGVRMEPARSTLRRAAIVFAGRIPTDAEYASIETGGIASLRKAIRRLMTGPGFHEFLIRGANDRLLTDRQDIQGVGVIDPIFGHFVDYNNLNHQKLVAGDPDYRRWRSETDYGVQRAPLELIAHVAENDRPYVEVLKGDYIMANPMAAEAYGDSVTFRNPSDAHEFKPSEIVSYYRKCDGHQMDYHLDTGAHVSNPGPCATDYPHAGILNTTVFLWRYPTTATNRNRARSRWTYYHFLGLDVEKSASRTTDPVALADTSNPTMHNPACTVCHTVLDPVAGAFQNYDQEGYFRSGWGGLDSLDGLYKDGGTPELVDVEAETYETRETVAATVMLSPEGMLAVRFANDLWDEETGADRNVYMDRLTVRRAAGAAPLFDVELEELTEEDLGEGDCGLATHDTHFAFYSGCRLRFDVDVPVHGEYRVEAVVWADQAGNELAQVAFSDSLYQDGDTWYRDMRSPGFPGKRLPDADHSLQWLARQIVVDPRFSQSTVKFWWPAVMGSDIAEPPSEGDPDFQGRLLASTAQAAEVQRLATGFRSGFHGGKRHNLKDLLTEIALSDWFRAESWNDGNAVRAIALAKVARMRLLTPEELAKKTFALTGFDWRRSIPRPWNSPSEALNWTNTERGYGLLYGGIDSGGITERGRDLTSVMAGIARRHAAEVSCPIVMKDLYLVAGRDRLLLSGIDPGSSVGQTATLSASAQRTVREKLVELHDTLLGVPLDADSPEIQAAYDLFVDVWRRTRSSDNDDFLQRNCRFHADHHYFDGILEDA